MDIQEVGCGGMDWIDLALNRDRWWALVFSGRCLCYELITRPEESHRLRCVVVCDLETSRMRP